MSEWFAIVQRFSRAGIKQMNILIIHLVPTAKIHNIREIKQKLKRKNKKRAREREDNGKRKKEKEK